MAMLTKVWLEEYMQVASVTAEHDKSTAHNYQKNPQWFGTGTQQPLLAAVTWSRRMDRRTKQRLQRGTATADGRRGNEERAQMWNKSNTSRKLRKGERPRGYLVCNCQKCLQLTTPQMKWELWRLALSQAQQRCPSLRIIPLRIRDCQSCCWVFFTNMMALITFLSVINFSKFK